MSASELTGESITPEGIEALRAEVEELETTARFAMAERIKTARELGDLKENADYHIAKEDQAHLETKIKQLRERLRKADVVDVPAEPTGDKFAFGRTAEVVDEASGTTHTWTLVGRAEADYAAGRLSVEAPVGRALRDRKVGDKVQISTPSGKRSYRIKSLVG